MFTFGETEYRWCPQCTGNIRNGAKYCRFCRKPLGNRLLQASQGIPPTNNIDSVSQWLPKFNSLLKQIPDEFRSRLEKADAEIPPSAIGVTPGIDPAQYRLAYRESGCCPHEPPEPHTEGLLYDILLSLHESGESLADICEYPQLQLIEVTPQEVLAEYELRKSEKEKNYPCPYCSEYIFPDIDACRFCEGSRGKRPRVIERTFEKEMDRALLKEVILYESARRRMTDAAPMSDEILSANAITAEMIDREILRLKMDADALLPLPRYFKRMIELKISMMEFFSVESMAINALIELGSSLDKRKINRVEEALIVYEHALARTQGKEELMDDRGRVAFYMALLFQGQENFENYDRYDKMSKECRAAARPPGMEALFKLGDDDLMSFASQVQNETDPEKKLSFFDKMIADSAKMLEESATALNQALPGMAEMFSGLTDSLGLTMKSSRLSMEAHIAKENGDLNLAESKYLEAISLTGDSQYTSAMIKCPMYCELGDIYRRQGKNADAQAYFDKAIGLANDDCELSPDLGKHTLWPCYLKLGCFQRETGALDLSEQSFEKALKLQLEAAEDMKAKYGGGEYDGFTAEIKSEYAKLMRVLGRAEEADRLDCEAGELRKANDAAVAESKAKQQRFKDHKSKGGS